MSEDVAAMTGSMVGVLGSERSEWAAGVDVVAEMPATKCDMAWFESHVMLQCA